MPEASVLAVASLKDAALDQDLDSDRAVAMAEELVGADFIPHRADGTALHIEPHGTGLCPYPREGKLRARGLGAF